MMKKDNVKDIGKYMFVVECDNDFLRGSIVVVNTMDRTGGGL